MIRLRHRVYTHLLSVANGYNTTMTCENCGEVTESTGTGDWKEVINLIEIASDFLEKHKNCKTGQSEL